jgi:hypothetical protein
VSARPREAQVVAAEHAEKGTVPFHVVEEGAIEDDKPESCRAGQDEGQ